MTSWNARWIAQTLKLPPSPDLDEVSFTALVTDSRKIVPGCLFIALKGDNFDGHQFIDPAIQNGAKGILFEAEKYTERTPGITYFPVADTLNAYRALSKAWRARFSIPVALVAGSNGKTTTKELLHALLQGKWERVLKTQGSQNGFVGIPMTLLELNSSHQAAVIEVGIDEPGAMKGHIDTVAPSVSVLTVVQPEHLEKLIDLKTVAREEGYALSDTLAQGGSIAVNCDDPNIAPHLSDPGQGKKLGYTLGAATPSPQLLCGKISLELKHLEVSGGTFTQMERFELPLPGRHNATNLLAAIAIGQLLGLTASEMRQGLARFRAPEGRSQVQKLSDNTVVICDYYNSQPASLRAGLELLKDLSHKSPQAPRWACLADMLELGPDEEKFHREPAAWIEQCGIHHVLLYGKRMKWLEEELKARGFHGTLKHFPSQAELASELAREAAPGSLILIKGSNSMKMGEVWKSFSQARQ